MTAYVVAMLNVTDPEGYEAYKELVPATLAKYGGRYVARGGPHEVLEGDIELNRMVVAEFESMEKAREWWASPEYEEAKVHRRKSSVANIMVVEGL